MTFNEQFFDASIRHQIDILRFGSHVARKVNALLDETRADLHKQVERRLGKGATGISGASLRRLRELERAVDQTRSPAWNDVTEEWTRSALDVALEEPIFVNGVLTNMLPVQLDTVMPSDALLQGLVTHRPFQGRTLKEWADSARRSDLTRIHQQIRIGMVQGESARDIANRVFGDRGAMQITRGQAEAVTRTVINGSSNAAQQLFLQENADLFDMEQLVATLDARTTPICRAQDGKQYPVGKGPVPPLHVACRSIRVAVIDWEVVGDRPFKAGTEQQMLREYGEAKGLGPLKSRDDLPRGSKKDFDAFSRKRMRELTGQVPARTSYQEWLSRQAADFQDYVLGPARGKLFREGGLTLDRFVNRQGDELTLDELRERNREAFDRTGLGDGSTQRQAQDDRRREETQRRAAELEVAKRRAEEERARADAAERERAAALQREAEERRRAEEARKAAEAAEHQRAAEEKARKADEKRRLAAERKAERIAEEQRQQIAELERKALEREKAIRAARQPAPAARPPRAEPKESLKQAAKRMGTSVDLGKVLPESRVQAVERALSVVAPQDDPDLFTLKGLDVRDRPGASWGGVYQTSRRELQVNTEEAYNARFIKPEAQAHMASPGFSAGGANYIPGNTQSIAFTTDDVVEMTVVHEYGHHIHLSRLTAGSAGKEIDDIIQAEFARPGRQDVSVYGQENHLEFWAESYTAYHYYPRAWLETRAPRTLQMVERVLALMGKMQ